MIRACDFSWTVVDDDGMEASLDPAEIYDFRFRWGGHHDRRRPPAYFSSSGTLVLNRVLSDMELESYQELKVEAGGHRYFDVVIADYEAETGGNVTTLLLQGRGAANADLEIEWGLRPSAVSPAVQVDEFVIPGVNIVTELRAPLAEIGCVSAPDPDQDFYTAPLRRIISGLESLGYFVLLEDVTAPEPTWRALPMPLNAESDHRSVGNRFGGYSHLIDINRYKRGLARHWAADRYKANVGGSPFNSGSVEFENLSINSVYNRSFGYYLGAPFISTARARVWTGSIAPRFAGFSRISIDRLDGPQPSYQTYVAPDGSYAGVVIHYNGDDVDAWGRVRYWVWDEDFDTDEWVLRANGKERAEKRTLGNRFFTIFQYDNNPELLQEVIDAWDEWYPTYARLEFLVEDLSVDSPARHKPGDRIGLDVSDLSHHAVIIGAEWRMRGNRVLRVRWDVLTQEEIPDARLFLGDTDHPLFLDDSDHGLYLER